MDLTLPLVPSRQGRGECLSLRAGGEAISGIWGKGILGRLLRHFVPRNDGKGREIKKGPGGSIPPGPLSAAGLLSAHRIEEAPVARGMLYLVEDDLHVAGSLELLEYDLVHTAARVDKGRCHDGETPALFDVPGRSEEPLGLVERVRVDAA